MLNTMEVIQTTRKNIHSLLERCHIAYEITPFDKDLYQECVEDAARRGYPVDGEHSIQTRLCEGVVYATTAAAHRVHRPTQIWIALCTSCAFFVDDTTSRFPSEIPNIYLFNDRFFANEPQASGVLDAFADILRRAPEIYPPVASQLFTTSMLRFVTGCMLEHETEGMKIVSTAQQYPIYQRTLTAFGDAYSLMTFPREIPLNHYIQAIPEMAFFFQNFNDVISFYKEECVGETTNQISVSATRTGKSKFETLDDLTETTIGQYMRIVEILKDSAEASEAFRLFASGYLRFHTSLERYRLRELDL